MPQFPSPATEYRRGLFHLHGFKKPSVSLVKPLITKIIRCHCQNIRARLRVEKPLFYPVPLVPRVKGQSKLLEQRRRHLTSDRFVYGIEITLVHDFVRFLNPAPAQIPVLNGDRGDFIRIVKPSEVYRLSCPAVNDFQGRFFRCPVCTA